MSVVYSIVIPVYNSDRIIPELHDRLIKTMESMGELFEIIFIDDCSDDNSWSLLNSYAKYDSRIITIQLMRNSGQGNATLAGFSQASGDFIITMDDDLQHPPEELPIMIRTLRNDNNIDVVIGVPKIKKHNLFRRAGSALANRINSILIGKHPSLRFTAFRIMRRNVINGVLSMHLPYPNVGPLIFMVTRRIKNIIVQHSERKIGTSGYTLSRLAQLTLSLFIGHSMLPLRILAVLGFMGIVISVLLSGYFLVRYLSDGTAVPGWTSLSLLLLALSGFNFFAFAIIGEYLLRVMQISANTSQWIIRSVYRDKE